MAQRLYETPQQMDQFMRFASQLQQLKFDVEMLKSASVSTVWNRVVKRRRRSPDPSIPEVTTPSHHPSIEPLMEEVTTPSHDPSIEPLPEVPPPMVSMSEVPAKIQEMETILQRLLRTVYGPKETPGSEGCFSEKVPKHGLVAECEWSWGQIKRGRAAIKYWSPFWYGLYAHLENSNDLDAIGKAIILAREQKNLPAEVAAEVAAVASGSSYSASSMVDVTHAATHAPSPWVEGSSWHTHAPSP
jgi:hypothetical protein